MCKLFKIFLIPALIFSSVALIPNTVRAQGYYKGMYVEKDKTKKEDKAKRPVPKVFSSKVSSVEQAEKLDKIYNDLFVSLWLYANTDFIYQKKLSTHIQPKKFKLTRYSKEFSGDLKDAMKNINDNYKNMMSDIEKAKEEYSKIKEGLRLGDQDIIEELWNEKISSFEDKAKTYFRMQYEFLKTYRNLVHFILKEGGGYYYNTQANELRFYKLDTYQIYVRLIDKLKKISFEQTKLLKSYPPANIDFELEQSFTNHFK